MKLFPCVCHPTKLQNDPLSLLSYCRPDFKDLVTNSTLIQYVDDLLISLPIDGAPIRNLKITDLISVMMKST